MVPKNKNWIQVAMRRNNRGITNFIGTCYSGGEIACRRPPRTHARRPRGDASPPPLSAARLPSLFPRRPDKIAFPVARPPPLCFFFFCVCTRVLVVGVYRKAAILGVGGTLRGHFGARAREKSEQNGLGALRFAPREIFQ